MRPIEMPSAAITRIQTEIYKSAEEKGLDGDKVLDAVTGFSYVADSARFESIKENKTTVSRSISIGSEYKHGDPKDAAFKKAVADGLSDLLSGLGYSGVRTAITNDDKWTVSDMSVQFGWNSTMAG